MSFPIIYRPKKVKWEYGQARVDFDSCVVLLVVTLILILLFIMKVAPAHAEEPPLWKMLVAENTRASYDEYLVLACVVKNRLQSGMNSGLIAGKRKNLDDFVQENVQYVKAKYGTDQESLAKKAIRESREKDVTGGATNYEHTGKYPAPKWSKNMTKTLVLNEGTKQELTCWRR